MKLTNPDRPLKLYGGKPTAPVPGLDSEQQAAHDALHESRLLLAVLEPDAEGRYVGVVSVSGVVTHFEIEGVVSGSCGMSGADINFASTTLVMGTPVAVAGFRTET